MRTWILQHFGRGGSDTTAIAVSVALGTKEVYIYSDVEGVFSADPHKISHTKKIDTLSYNEMKELSKEGAKVLDNKCVELGELFNVNINTKSTFNENVGTVISLEAGNIGIKSIVQSDISRISVVGTRSLKE